MTLVADEPETARRLTRMLLAHGAPSVRWLDGSDQSMAELVGLLQAIEEQPDLLVIGMMSSAEATASMIRCVRSAPGGRLLPIAALLPGTDRQLHEMQFAAGANVVVERLVEDSDYRREAARLVSYWVRTQRLNALGA
jgi:CheY-like chemotaxis protein